MSCAQRWVLWVALLLAMPAWGASPIVFCYNPLVDQPGLSPMAMVGCDNTPVQFVGKVATGFAKLPQPQRCLMLFGVLYDPPIFTPANLKTNTQNGPDLTVDTRYLQLVFGQLKARELVPARIVMDLEGSTSTWGLTPSNGTLSSVLMPIYSDSAVYAKLPASVKQFSPADFDTFNTRGVAAITAWNAWQNTLMDQALRQAVVVTANNVFGINIPATNYQDILPSFPVYDLNNWPICAAAVGSESSPCLYLTVDGNRYLSLQKDARWNHFIDALNQARSAIRNGPVVPWIANPSYAGDSHLHSGCPWLWREQIKHLNAMGITSYLLFDPAGGTLPSDDQYASTVFRTIQTLSGVPADFGPIPLDSDTVTTGTITTKYTDFIANLLGGASAVMK